MPTPTYTPLANITLGSSAASVTFSSISQAYRDLVLVFNGNMATSSIAKINFNGDTTNTNYNAVFMYGDGSTAYSGSSANPYFFRFALNSAAILNIMDYTATDKHKTILSRSDNENYVDGRALRWANTAAITSFVISSYSGNYAAGSTFALYGIAA